MRYFAFLLLGSLPLLAQGANQTTIALDLDGLNATRHEIALLQSFEAICPAMLAPGQHNAFYIGINRELSALLPKVPNPRNVVKYLETTKEYQVILQDIMRWTQSFPVKENRALCKEFAQST